MTDTGYVSCRYERGQHLSMPVEALVHEVFECECPTCVEAKDHLVSGQGVQAATAVYERWQLCLNERRTARGKAQRRAYEAPEIEHTCVGERMAALAQVAGLAEAATSGVTYSEELQRGILVDDGKYRFYLKPGDYRIFVDRCGEPWLVMEGGSKAVLSMMMELDEARKKLLEMPSAEEQRILKEMQQAKIVAGCHRGIQCCAKFGEEARANYVCQAELARRAVKVPMKAGGE